MASAMRVFRKFRASDGRIKIATLSGVSALVAVIAMLVGVLPVFANHLPVSTTEGVPPVQVDWGGGSGACDDDLNALNGGEARGPSAAEWEAHLQNPKPGKNTITGNDPDGTQVTITVDDNGEFFEFSIESGMVAHDVVVNGGKKSNHYDYDEPDSVGIVPSDEGLSAPVKDNKDELHNLSHINLCYDVAKVTFTCGGAAEDAFRFGDGLSGEEFTKVTARIFTVGGDTDCTKDGIFFINNEDVEPTVELDFGSDGPTVVGRADFKKVVEDPNDLDGLRYDPTQTGNFVEMQWCSLDEVDPPDENHEFADFLEPDEYPSLEGITDGDDQAIACKVYEEEDASGFQHTVVYFEFEDPQFR